MRSIDWIHDLESLQLTRKPPTTLVFGQYDPGDGNYCRPQKPQNYDDEPGVAETAIRFRAQNPRNLCPRGQADETYEL